MFSREQVPMFSTTIFRNFTRHTVVELVGIVLTFYLLNEMSSNTVP